VKFISEKERHKEVKFILTLQKEVHILLQLSEKETSLIIVFSTGPIVKYPLVEIVLLLFFVFLFIPLYKPN
jgi:hypothetical protein